MIDLHTHSIFSDGELLPSELVRRAVVHGYTAIAITDHVDFTNIEYVLDGIKKARYLEEVWDIRVLAGVEITHVPPQKIPALVDLARELGSEIVVVHGETLVEPVLTGTNKAAIEAGADILAHPGLISKEDALLAADLGVCLEITARCGHNRANGHVVRIAEEVGADLETRRSKKRLEPKQRMKTHLKIKLNLEMNSNLKLKLNPEMKSNPKIKLNPEMKSNPKIKLNLETKPKLKIKPKDEV